MAPRIKTKPADLAIQCSQAAAGITGEANWPVTAPTAVVMTGHGTALSSGILSVADLEAQLATARAALAAAVTSAREDMIKVDQATDMLYGEDGPQKNNFGLTPKQSSPTTLGLPTKVIIREIRDGAASSSLFVDWEAQDAAAYEIQWFSDSAMTAMVGSAATTPSEFTISGLTKSTQYWIRVRAIRAGSPGPWSDPATRVAGI